MELVASNKLVLTIALILAAVRMGEAASSCSPDCLGSSTGDKVKVPWDCTQYAVCAATDSDGILRPSDPVDCNEGDYFETVHDEPRCDPIDGADADFCQNTCSPCEILWTHAGDTSPSPTECTQFYVSLDGGVLLGSACIESTPYYDFITGQCQTDPAFCFDFCDNCMPYCLEEGNVPDPYDCTSFYRCSPPDAVHFQCPADQHFDPVRELCTTTTVCNEECVAK